MAGHSKWANIKHRKGRQDAKRGKIFTKLMRSSPGFASNPCDFSPYSDSLSLRLRVSLP